jgi:hypothetical protein
VIIAAIIDSKRILILHWIIALRHGCDLNAASMLHRPGA